MEPEICEIGELILIEENFPYNTEYFICPICDSTYNVEREIVFEADF
jgi:hypothetical protein